MSRVVWGNIPANQSKPQGRQTTLPLSTVATSAGRKRERDVSESTGTVADDQVMWGPSGGNNRETQGKRWRPFMNGAERQAVFDSSPYSRQFVGAWKEERGAKGGATTEFDCDVLLQSFVKDGCPRNLFEGKVFFLNSCDSDPLASVYVLEKIIRYLGGLTSMSVSSAVAYVVTHHLCSAKEMRREGASNRPAGRTRWIHPHFILECAKQGCLVSDAPYLLQQNRSRPVDAPPSEKKAQTERPAVREREYVEIADD